MSSACEPAGNFDAITGVAVPVALIVCLININVHLRLSIEKSDLSCGWIVSS